MKRIRERAARRAVALGVAVTASMALGACLTVHSTALRTPFPDATRIATTCTTYPTDDEKFSQTLRRHTRAGWRLSFIDIRESSFLWFWNESRYLCFERPIRRAAQRRRPANAVTEPAPTPQLPYTLSRAQVEESLTGPIDDRVGACAKGQHGRADVRVEIASGGTVERVEVFGELADTDVGRCIAGVVEQATFPKFRAARMRVAHTFVF